MSGGDGYLTNPLYREIAKLMTDAGITHRVDQGAKHFHVKFWSCGREMTQILHLGPNCKGSTYRKTIIRFRKIVAAERAWLEQEASSPKEIVMQEEPKPPSPELTVAKQPACGVSPIYALISRVLAEQGIAFRVEPRAAYDVLFAMCRTGEKRIDIRPNAKPHGRTIERAEMWLKRIVALKPYRTVDEAHSNLQVQAVGINGALRSPEVERQDRGDFVRAQVGDSSRLTMSSREIADLTGKRHDNVRADIEKMGQELSLTFQEKSEASDGGRPSMVYYLSKRETQILVSGYSIELRARIIDRWQELEERLAAPSISAADMLNDPAMLRSLLLANTEQVLALKGAVEEMKPQVQALERIALSDGSLCITDAAKTLQVQPKALFGFLRGNGWIYSRAGGSEVAYQDKLQNAFLEHKTTTITRSDGTEKTVTQVRITPKGLTRLAQDLPRAGVKPYTPDLFAVAIKGRTQ